MSANRTRNVMPSGDGWTVLEAGNMNFRTRDEAIDYGRRMLQNTGGGTLVILDENGGVADTENVEAERPDEGVYS